MTTTQPVLSSPNHLLPQSSTKHSTPTTLIPQGSSTMSNQATPSSKAEAEAIAKFTAAAHQQHLELMNRAVCPPFLSLPAIPSTSSRRSLRPPTHPIHFPSPTPPNSPTSANISLPPEAHGSLHPYLHRDYQGRQILSQLGRIQGHHQSRIHRAEDPCLLC